MQFFPLASFVCISPCEIGKEDGTEALVHNCPPRKARDNGLDSIIFMTHLRVD